jgi:hypothetical protein
MDLDVFVFYIENDNGNDNGYGNDNDNDNGNDNGNGKIIILKEDINLITLQKYLCKKLNNSYLFINYYDKYYENIIYHKYNNNIYGIIKQSINVFYIWKIKS